MNMEYNTVRPAIILKEYGRNVQKLVEYMRSIPSKEKRTELAYSLLELIKQLSPSNKEAPENPQRLWDDLYIIADFNIDVNNPFPVPKREVLFKKPMRMEYPHSTIRFKHYGKNIELLIDEALKKEDPKEREEAAIYLGKLMKTFYGSWNKETLDDSVILKDLDKLSGGKLTLNLDKVREENLFEKLYKEKKKPRPERNQRQKSYKKNNLRRRRDQ